jgi:hypothetical protein
MHVAYEAAQSLSKVLSISVAYVLRCTALDTNENKART